MNSRRQRDNETFEQGEAEMLSDVWAHFKRLVRNSPHNGIPDFVQIEIYYGGLNRPSQKLANALIVGGLMDKTYIEAKKILDRISKNNDEWVDMVLAPIH